MLAGISCKQRSVIEPKFFIRLRAVTSVLLIILDALRTVQAEVLIGTADFSFVFAFQAKPSFLAHTVFKELFVVGLIQVSHVIDCTIQV